MFWMLFILLLQTNFCICFIPTMRTFITVLLHALSACAAPSEFSLLLFTHNEDIHKCFYMIFIYMPVHAIFVFVSNPQWGHSWMFCYMIFTHVLLQSSFHFCFIPTLRTFINVLLHALHACAVSSEYTCLLYTRN